LLPITVHDGRVFVGERFSVSFQRTPRAGDPLKHPPVSRGHLPAHAVTAPLPSSCPSFAMPIDVVIPCEAAESLWLGFAGAGSRPVAVKIFAGGINALTGGPRDDVLHGDPQDYLVVPEQASWHGISGEAGLRQFSGEPMALVIYEPAAPIDRAHGGPRWDGVHYATDDPNADRRGPDPFAIVTDPYGIAAWASQPDGRVTVACVDAACWRSMTGDDPPSPRSEYQGWRLP
jgi:hypothetical protein